MSEFRQYQHIERFGTSEVENIEFGLCYVFPKIDGTNSSVWYNDGVNAGSRKKELNAVSDNAGFFLNITENENIIAFLTQYPELRLYGEWLVPHSLKTYKEDAWRKFYVFDVTKDLGDDVEYLNYNEYQPMLEAYKIDYIPCIATIKNGTYEQFIHQLERNDFLIEDGKGTGEGLVIKNYTYRNKYGRQTWAKVVTSDFKEKHAKVMGAPEIDGKKMIEDEIVKNYCTTALIEKTFAKIENENDGWSSKYIPQLLGRVYHDLVIEEIWGILKKYKYPSINFKTLNYFTIMKIKETLPRWF